MQDCTSWNKSRMSCKRCKTAYNRQLEQNAKNSVLKQWWQNLQPHEKVAWFKKQRMLNPNKYGRRKYDADKIVNSDFKEKKKGPGRPGRLSDNEQICQGRGGRRHEQTRSHEVVEAIPPRSQH